MKGSTATKQAPSARAIPAGAPASLEETAFGRRYIDPEAAKRYDLLVVGRGEAAITAASEAARLGARVALALSELPGPGGPESRRVPAGALRRSARAIGDARIAATLGLQGLESAWFDYGIALERARAAGRLIAETRHPKRLRDLGIDLFVGEPHFTAPRVLAIGKRVLRFDKALLASDGAWTFPDVPGFAGVGFSTPDTLDALSELPARLAVLGSGPEACELAQTFARFGSTVTLVDPRERILTSEDADAAARVRRALTEDGVRILEGFEVKRAELTPSGKRLMLAETGSGSLRPLDIDAIVVVQGRAAEVAGLELERAGLRPIADGVAVDERLRTQNDRIFAAGAFAAGTATSQDYAAPGTAHAHLAVRNALCLGRGAWESLVVPRCVLTDPEVVHVGLRRRQAENQGLAVETFRADFSAVERAVLDAEDEGFLKLHSQRKTGRIVGATLVSRHASESLDALTMALQQGLTLDAFAGVVRPRPTQTAAVLRAADPFVARHLPLRAARWIEMLLRLVPRKR